MGKSSSTSLIIGENYNEEVLVPQFKKNNDSADLGALYAMKDFMSFIFNNKNETLRIAMEAEKYRQSLVGLMKMISD